MNTIESNMFADLTRIQISRMGAVKQWIIGQLGDLKERKQPLPVTISLPDEWTPSAWKANVPASSLFRLDKVRACFFPRAVMRQWGPNFNFAPSLVQEPSTSAWLSSTSRVTVSVSFALVSFRPFITWIFLTEWRKKCLLSV